MFSPGDANCDGVLDEGDIAPFVLALVDPSAYASAHPGCSLDIVDVNNDESADGEDVGAFVSLLLG